MAENSKIEWTTHTFNPWMGCTKVSPACQHCYAERDMDKRLGKVAWGPNGTRVKTTPAYWDKPLKWNRDAGKTPGVRPRVFCASLADVFEDWQGPIVDHNGKELTNATIETAGPNAKPLTMDDLRRDLFELIDATPNLDWLLLTKRPENIQRMVPEAAFRADDSKYWSRYRANVWLGVSVENQEQADKRIPLLTGCSDLSSTLFLSCEPLLGAVSSFDINDPEWTTEQFEKSYEVEINWVIAGGESGPNARPSHPDWFRSLRDQCEAAGVPFLFKQWGEWGCGLKTVSDHERGARQFETGKYHDFGDAYMALKVGKKSAGRLLDGVEHNGFPRVTPCQET